MEIRQFFYSVARKWWLIILLTGLGAGLGFLIKPTYQANTSIYIMNHDMGITTNQLLDSQNLVVFQQLVQQYSGIISSRLVISAVLRDVINYDVTEKGLLAMVSIDSNKDSNIFKIGAKASDPAVATAVANAFAREFINQFHQLTNSDILSILDEAKVPNYPVSNNVLNKILLGALVGLMFAFSIIYVIEYFDTTVRSAKDIENGLKVRVIGIIPEHDIR